MKLVRVESFHTRQACVVRVTAEDGARGVGMCAPSQADVTAAVLHRLVAPVAVGRDAGDVEEIVDRCYEANYKFTGTFLCRALAGLDTALWDLRGRRAGKGVCELLGGRPRAMPVYGSCMRRDTTPREQAERIARFRDRDGYRAFKVKVGGRLGTGAGLDRDAAPGRTEGVAREVRRAVGDGVKLYADANGSYSAAGAVAVGRVLEGFGFCHYEEPCPYWDVESTAEVAAALDVPVAGGEQDFCLHQWRRIVAARAVDVAQPDVCYVGGMTRALRVARMAEAAGLPCVPHSSNRSMTLVFALHLMAAIPNAAEFVECGVEATPWAAELFDPVLEVRDGRVSVPEGPGWGVTFRQDWLDRAERTVTESDGGSAKA